MSQNSSPWPDGYAGAISLTFDDGHPSQLQKAIPILDSLGFKGTFFLCPKGDNWTDDLAPWRQVFANGHEIGNHTVSHTCSRALAQDRDRRCLENLTLEDIELDILEAARRINMIVPEQEVCTFCYPCYNNHVGEGHTRQSYVPVVAKHFPAARGIGEFPFGNYPETCDLHYLWSWPVEGKQGIELVGFC